MDKMKYKALMGLSAFALASFIFSSEGTAEAKQVETPSIVQQQVETGGVKKATLTPMTKTESAKQLKKVKSLSNLPVASSKAALSNIMLQEMRAFNGSFDIEYDGQLTIDDIKEALQAANKDTYVYGTRSNGTYGYSYKNGKLIVNIKMNYNHTKAQEAELTTAVKNITNDIIQPSMSDVEKIKAVNDYVVTHTVYSKTGTKTTPHSPYTIISEGKGVCQAYALLTYRLLEEAGIENMYVTGYAGEAHAWNLVKVDGNWYHLDTTWNDPTYDNINYQQEKYMTDFVRYKYFLISDATISADHQIDAGYPTTAPNDYIKGLSQTASPLLTVSSTVGEKYLMSQTVYLNGAWYATNSNYQLVKIADSQVTVLSSLPAKVYGLTYANGKLFYTDYNRLYSYNLKTNKEKLLATGKIQKITVENGILKASADGKLLYSEDVNGNVSVVYTRDTLLATLNKVFPLLSTLSGAERQQLSNDYNNAFNVWLNPSSSDQQIADAVALLNQYLPKDPEDDMLDNDVSHEDEISEQEEQIVEENVYKEALDKVLSKLQQYADEVHVEDKAIQQLYSDMIAQGEAAYEQATEADVDSLTKQMTQAFETYFVNGYTKTALQYQSGIAYGLYTATGGERFDALVNARAQAEVVLDDEEATTEQIEQAIYQLKQAIFNAKSKFDKTALLALIEQARAAGNLEDVVSQAQAVVEQDDASKAQIQEVMDLLEKALKKTDIPEEEKQIIDRAAVEIFICRYPDFGKLAGNLLEQLSKYSDEQKKQLPTETLEKIEQVQVLQTKMETFEASLTDKQAWAATPKKTTNALKPWTISLSTPVAHTVQNAKYIKVYDMFGEEIEVEVSLNGKQITVTPQQQYEPEMMYTLSIDKNLTSQSGKKLKKDLYVQFQFETE